MSTVSKAAKEWLSEKSGQNVKNVNGRGSTELVHTNIVERLGGVMNKYTKHKSFTAPCIRDTSITLFDRLGRHFYKQILSIF